MNQFALSLGVPKVFSLKDIRPTANGELCVDGVVAVQIPESALAKL
jgi:hypothetical protein